MQTLEELKAQQLEAYSKLEKQWAISNAMVRGGLPAPGYVSDSVVHGAVLVAYHNTNYSKGRSLFEALEILRGVEVMPFRHYRRYGSLSFVVPRWVQDEENFETTVDKTQKLHHAMLKVSYSHESTKPVSASLNVFLQVEQYRLALSIEFGTGYIGHCEGLRPEIHGSGKDREFLANPYAFRLSEDFAKYKTFDPNSADHRFLFGEDWYDKLTALADIVEPK